MDTVQDDTKYKISADAKLQAHWQFCKPTTNQYPARMRSRALNQLLYCTPDVTKQIKATTSSSPSGAELPVYFVNAIIDEAT